MYLIQNIIALVIGLGILGFILLIAWYIALPLFLIFLILYFLGFFKEKTVSFKINPHISVKSKKSSKHKKESEIIDVEYKEVK